MNTTSTKHADDDDDDDDDGGLEHDDLEVLELHHLHHEQDGDSDPTARYLRADDDEVDVRALAHVYANADDDEGEGYTVEQLSRDEDTSSSQESNLDLARSGPIPINVRDQFDDSVDDDDGLQLCNTSYEAEVEEDEDEDKNVSAFISPDASEAARQDETATEDEGGSRGETTRSIMARLAIKLGKQPDDVLPFTLQLEKEWLLTRQQLRTTLASDDDAVFHRLQFPLGLVFALKEELGITEGDVPNMLKYKVLKKQIEQKQLRAGSGNGGGAGGDTVDKDGSPGGGRPGGSVAGRKRKRLTVADWREKVERFALDTQHAPSPFRATSIFQVECFCCGYAVNMNKPGQLYYLRRHVEGVRPDIRMSNHTKNYRRWQRQYQAGVNMDELPPLPREPKKQRTAQSTAGNEEANDEGLERAEFSAGADEEEHSERETSPTSSSSSIPTYAPAAHPEPGDGHGSPGSAVPSGAELDLVDLAHLQHHGDHHQPLPPHRHHLTQVAMEHNPHSFHNTIISAPLPSLVTHAAPHSMSHLLSPHHQHHLNSSPPQPALLPLLHNLQPHQHQHHQHHQHQRHPPQHHHHHQLLHSDMAVIMSAGNGYSLPPLLSTTQHHHHHQQPHHQPPLDKDSSL